MEKNYFGQMDDAEEFNPKDNYECNDYDAIEWDFEAREAMPLEHFSNMPNPMLIKLIKKHR